MPKGVNATIPELIAAVQQPTVRISALITPDNDSLCPAKEVLLVKETEGAFAGAWQLPGGALLPGRTFHNSITAHVLRQTGQLVTSVFPTPHSIALTYALIQGEPRSFLELCFRVETSVPDGHRKPRRVREAKVTAVRMCTPRDLIRMQKKKVEFAPTCLQTIDHALRWDVESEDSRRLCEERRIRAMIAGCNDR